MTDTTSVLVISGDGMPPYAVRNISQTLEPIDAAKSLRRTVNGRQVNVAAEQFRLYKSTISCTDQQPPAFDNVWPGDVLTVDCVKELSYKTAGGSPQRTVVSGSSRTEGDFTFYRPQLTMVVQSKSESTEEYSADNPWTIDLEEQGS
jgi:hypothetical protein